MQNGGGRIGVIESRNLPNEDYLSLITMLNTKDVKMLRGMFGELLEANNHVLKREIRDEVHSLIKASEAGLIRRMDAMEQRLHNDLISFIDDDYSPRMYGCEQGLAFVKHHLKVTE